MGLVRWFQSQMRRQKITIIVAFLIYVILLIELSVLSQFQIFLKIEATCDNRSDN